MHKKQTDYFLINRTNQLNAPELPKLKNDQSTSAVHKTGRTQIEVTTALPRVVSWVLSLNGLF